MRRGERRSEFISLIYGLIHYFGNKLFSEDDETCDREAKIKIQNDTDRAHTVISRVATLRNKSVTQKYYAMVGGFFF